jgi:hypothetical protein
LRSGSACPSSFSLRIDRLRGGKMGRKGPNLSHF